MGGGNAAAPPSWCEVRDGDSGNGSGHPCLTCTSQVPASTGQTPPVPTLLGDPSKDVFPFPSSTCQRRRSALGRRGGDFIPVPLDLYKAKAPAGPCLQHLSSQLPWDCFRSTEEPKLARDKGAAFPAAMPRGPDQRDWGCFRCHLLQSQVSSSAGTWSEEEERASEEWGSGTPRFGASALISKPRLCYGGPAAEGLSGTHHLPNPPLQLT